MMISAPLMPHQASVATVVTIGNFAKRAPTMIKQRQATIDEATRKKRSKNLRIKLFVLVTILFHYLEKVDPEMLDLAKEILKDCERKHNTKDSKYQTLADAIADRLLDVVGEAHWMQARKIQKQLAANQLRRKMKAALKERNV